MLAQRVLDSLHQQAGEQPEIAFVDRPNPGPVRRGDGRNRRGDGSRQRRPALFDAETAELDRLLAQRGRTAVIERFDLRTGTARRFTIGAEASA